MKSLSVVVTASLWWVEATRPSADARAEEANGSVTHKFARVVKVNVVDALGAQSVEDDVAEGGFQGRIRKDGHLWTRSSRVSSGACVLREDGNDKHLVVGAADGDQSSVSRDSDSFLWNEKGGGCQRVEQTRARRGADGSPSTGNPLDQSRSRRTSSSSAPASP